MATQAEVELSIQQQADHRRVLESALITAGYVNTKPRCNGFTIRVEVRATGGSLVRMGYVHVLPWSRGWSVFVSPDPTHGVYNWRDVPAPYKHMQCALYTPKYVTGPQHVFVDDIVRAVDYCINAFLDATQRARDLHERDLATVEAAFRRKLNERTRRALAARTQERHVEMVAERPEHLGTVREP